MSRTEKDGQGPGQRIDKATVRSLADAEMTAGAAIAEYEATAHDQTNARARAVTEASATRHRINHVPLADGFDTKTEMVSFGGQSVELPKDDTMLGVPLKDLDEPVRTISGYEPAKIHSKRSDAAATNATNRHLYNGPKGHQDHATTGKNATMVPGSK